MKPNYQKAYDEWVDRMPQARDGEGWTEAYDTWWKERPASPPLMAPTLQIQELEFCDSCMEHCIADSQHKYCNQYCRPPFHSGGGTWAPTSEMQEAVMTAAYVKHFGLKDEEGNELLPSYCCAGVCLSH